MYNENELTHHGILGQKWGVRRYQNKDGSLTEKGKKHYSEEYKKLSVKAQEEVITEANYVKAYNKAADIMNNGGIDKYNREYRKKIGDPEEHDYLNDDEYMKGYEKAFSDVFDTCYKEVITEAWVSNKYYKMAEELCNKYNMVKWDKLAKDNTEAINEAKKYLK